MDDQLSNYKAGVFFLLLILIPEDLLAEKGGTGFHDPTTIVFTNFSKPVILEKKHGYYQVKGTNETVVLSNRLIVKTHISISEKWLLKQHRLVRAVRLLFGGVQNNYYLIEIEDEHLLSVALNHFQQLEDVDWVQPDLLQLDHHSGARSLTTSKIAPPLTPKEEELKEARRAERIANREERKSAHANLIREDPSPYISLLHLPDIWKRTRGEGIRIAVIDDGFNLEHEDLQHLTPVFSYDSNSQHLDAKVSHRRDNHGTKVAGIIFADHNQKGIDGIAPEAEFIALRQPDTWTSNTLVSFQLAKLAGASIVNCSWHSHWLLQPIQEVVSELATYGREGKGIAVVFAAGNEGREILPETIEASIESAIVVGAQNAEADRLKSSNYGDTVDLFVYGARAQTTLISGKYGNFAATSLAASIISGISALLLAQNPEMTLEDLQSQLEAVVANQR